MKEVLRVHEVSPRDGLQNESVILSTQAKLKLLELLAAAQPDSLEVTSFVRSDRVPQLADSAELCAALREVPWRRGLPLVGLVLNRRGYERFRESGLDAITAVIGANQAFSQANAGMSVEQACQANQALVADALADGFPVRMYLSMAFASPQDGVTDPQVVLDLVAAAKEMGVERVMLADTVGLAQPKQVEQLVGGALEMVSVEELGLHMHDTYGRALENCSVAMQMGIRMFDASAAGTGGCPFAPGSAGNLATEDLLRSARALGWDVGMQMEALERAADFLRQQLRRPTLS